MSIDKQALREAADKAASEGEGSWQAWREAGQKHPEVFTSSGHIVATVNGAFGVSRSNFIAAANPATVLALLDELEAAQHEKDELRQGFIANQEEAHEAIKYATEIKEQLARACAGREEAFREVDEMQKSLDHTHRRRSIWRGRSEEAEAKLEAAEKRLDKLEALTVNLPKRSVGEVMHMSGFSRDYAEGWCSGNDNAIHEIRAAGIGVKGE